MEGFGSLEFSNTVQLLEKVDSVYQTARELDDLNTLVNPPVPRVIFRDQLNPLERYNDKDFKANYGFSKDGFMHVLDIFEPKLQARTNRSQPHTPLLKLSVYLQYLRYLSLIRICCVHTIAKYVMEFSDLMDFIAMLVHN